MRLHSLVHGQLLGRIIVEISAVPQARISEIAFSSDFRHV